MILPRTKIHLSDNVKITSAEYALASTLCDIIAAVVSSARTALPGGLFWGEVDKTRPHSLFLRKDNDEINYSLLLNNRFRDFPTIIYQFDHLTPTPDFWVRRYVRLCQAVPKRWRVKIPPRFGEIGWNVDGFPVNKHTCYLQERINMALHFGMEQSLDQSMPRALEVGTGSGEMGHILCSAVPGLTWYACDLAQCLIYHAIHMAIWFPQKHHCIYIGDLPLAGVDERYVVRSARDAAVMTDAVISIPHFLLEDFTGHLSLQAAFNAWSFSEMPEQEVLRYASFLQKHLTGMLIEQNGDYRDHGGSNAADVLAALFPARRSSQDVFSSLPLPGLLGGPMNAWSNAEISQNELDLAPYYDPNDTVPDLKYDLSEYGLLDQAIGRTLS